MVGYINSFFPDLQNHKKTNILLVCIHEIYSAMVGIYFARQTESVKKSGHVFIYYTTNTTMIN